MNPIRRKAPIERPNPKAVTHYREYKNDLKDDFNCRCGYCDALHDWVGGIRFYQLDHFVPKKHLSTISEHEFSNLVYSCFYCNNAKRAKWPSKDEKVHNDGKEGFVHPRNDEYIKHLNRNINGSIQPITELGNYMFKALHLHLKRHSVIWNLEKIEDALNSIQEEYDRLNGKLPDKLYRQIADLSMESRKYIKLLKKENE